MDVWHSSSNMEYTPYQIPPGACHSQQWPQPQHKGEGLASHWPLVAVVFMANPPTGWKGPWRRRASSPRAYNITMTCYGDRSFLVNGAAVWNSLPVAPRSPDTSLDIVKDKLSSSELSTECAFAALANMRGINHPIVIIIIIMAYGRCSQIRSCDSFRWTYNSAK